MLREFGGWLGVWNCQDGGGLLSDQGLPNFLPSFLGGGTNGILHGDFGYSIFTGRPVLEHDRRAPAGHAHPDDHGVRDMGRASQSSLGVIAAVKRYSLFDQCVTFTSYIFYSLPTFWLGLILIYIFAVASAGCPPRASSTAAAPPACSTRPVLERVLGQPRCRQSLDIGQAPDPSRGDARGGQRGGR